MSNMKRMVAAGVLLAAMAATSATAAELKIGYVDLKAAVEGTGAYQEGMKRLEALQNRRQKELDAMGDKIQAAEKEVEGQQFVMAPDKLADKQNDIKEMRKAYARKQQDAQEELMGEKTRIEQAVFGKLFDAMRELGAKEKYDFILPKSTILYAASSHDVTADITRMLDKKEPAGK